MAGKDAIAVPVALGVYLSRVVPAVRRELGRWRGEAESIPDPVLRRTALSALREKGSNVEATAVFAILAPRAHRAAALRAMTALQVAVDCLDTLEEGGTDERRSADEDGYLAALFAACWEEAARLPAAAAVLPLARRAFERCGEGQRHTHAAAGGADGGALERWARRLPAPGGYEWWEVAAGASSSVAAHALIAAAADPRTTGEQAELLDAAYFPPIGALTVLLDDLVDREADLAAGEHNYISYYASAEAAADRLALIAARAEAATAPLRRAGRHRAILAGIAAFYLAAPAARRGYARPVRERLLETLGPAVRPLLAARRLRRRA